MQRFYLTNKKGIMSITELVLSPTIAQKPNVVVIASVGHKEMHIANVNFAQSILPKKEAEKRIVTKQKLNMNRKPKNEIF